MPPMSTLFRSLLVVHTHQVSVPVPIPDPIVGSGLPGLPASGTQCPRRRVCQRQLVKARASCYGVRSQFGPRGRDTYSARLPTRLCVQLSHCQTMFAGLWRVPDFMHAVANSFAVLSRSRAILMRQFRRSV